MEYKHVYCVNCIRGDKLVEAIVKELDIPKICEECYPYDFEDSRGNDLRIKYEEKHLQLD